MVITGAVTGSQPYIAVAFIVGAFLTLIYLFRVFTMVFLGEAKTVMPKEGSPGMVTSVATLAFMSLFCGIFISYIYGPVQTTVTQMLSILK